MLIGDSSKACGEGASPSGPAGSTSGISRGATVVPSSSVSTFFSAWIFTSNSHLPRLEIDARIDPGIGEVGYQINDEADERENVEIGEHHRVVAIEHAFETQQAEPVERENGCDQQRAGKERADERAGEAGDHQHHGVAEDMAVEHLPLGAALGARGQHVLLAQFLEKG